MLVTIMIYTMHCESAITNLKVFQRKDLTLSNAFIYNITGKFKNKKQHLKIEINILKII